MSLEAGLEAGEACLAAGSSVIRTSSPLTSEAANWKHTCLQCLWIGRCGVSEMENCHSSLHQKDVLLAHGA